MEIHEQHEMLIKTLEKLVPVLNCDELELLANSCGVQVDEFYYPHQPIQFFTSLETKHDYANETPF